MFALFIVVNYPEYLEDILSKLVNLGVKGATILDSQGMGSAIVQQGIDSIPIFGSLKTLLSGSNPYSKTIFTIINEEHLLHETMHDVEKIFQMDKKTQAGLMFTVPVSEVRFLGYKK